MKHIDYYLDIIQKKSSSAGGGGITPVGTKTIDITQNGSTEHDVTSFAKAKVNVNVPQTGITPSGKKQITANGKYDVTAFAEADVAVPVPPEPAGKTTISVTENGVTTHDVTAFAQAEVNVNVPVPEEPAGEKVIDIVANGTHTEDIKKFATAKINVAVPSTGITPQGTKTITENGTHDVAQFAQAKVNVPVGVNPSGTKEISVTQNGEVTEDVTNFKNVHIVTNVPSTGGGTGVSQEKYDSLLQALQTQTQAYSFTNADITSLRDSAFYNDKQLSSVTLQNATHVGANAFERCTLLSKCSVDKMQTCGDSAFSRANLSQAVFPNLSAIARNMFVFCSYLKKVKCDKAISIDERAFNGCASLEVIDILGGGNISAPSTSELYKLKSVVLRGTENVTPTSDTIWLPSSVTIYVPDSLVEQYKSATNWSSRTIKPLSEYVEV